MPNRQRLPSLPTPARPRDQSDAESWVFVAFCVASYVAIVVLVFLSSHAGQVMAG
jgi:bacteriorhodopsin